jgi:hypothetical protein
MRQIPSKLRSWTRRRRRNLQAPTLVPYILPS